MTLLIEGLQMVSFIAGIAALVHMAMAARGIDGI